MIFSSASLLQELTQTPACVKNTQKRLNVSDGDTDIFLFTALHYLLKSHRNKDYCERRRRKERG